MAHKVVDVCVVGGGLVGGAFASALAKSNIAVKAAMKICVLEASKLKSQPTSNPNFSNRVVSLNPSAADFLKDIGVWDNIDKEKRYPYYNINVLDSVSNTPLSFSTESADFKSPIAYIVENEAMINGISQSLLNYKSSNPNFTVHDSTKVGSIALLQNSAKSGFLDNDWPVIELEDGSTIQSRLIVGSDGGNSIVRQFAEIESHGFDYSQTAIVATLKIAELDDNLSAWQRFLPTGPVAMLPLAPGYSSLVWSLPSRLSAQVSRLPSETFIHLLNTAFQNPLLDLQFMLSQIQQGKEKDVNFEAEMKWGQERAAGQTQRVGDASSEAVGWKGGKVPLVTGLPNDNRAGFPLRLRHAKEYIKNRIALIGDAAHTIHPMAGQGLNLGLEDAKSLSEAVLQAVVDGSDIGNIHSLQPYSANRYISNSIMLGGVDLIGRIFSVENGAFAWLRGIGMGAFGRIPGLKEQVVRFATHAGL